MSTDIKEVVKARYGQAALRVKTGGSSCCGASPSGIGQCDPITSNLYDTAQTGDLPQKRYWLRLVAEIRLRWPSCAPVKLCSISVPVAASMSSFQQSEWGRQEKRTGWT